MTNDGKAGFTYTLETIKDGQVIDREMVHNLIPIEGLNYLIGAGLKAGAAYSTWFVGLYSGGYTPVPGDTAQTFPGTATELTAYSETTRRPVTLGDIANGAVDNQAAEAEFTGNTDGRQALGGFVASAPAKGATTGVLISAVRFSSPKNLDAGTKLRVTVAFSLVSN